MTDNKRLSLYLVLAAAFLLRLYFIITSHYISPDGTHYAGLGYNLFHFFIYQSNGAQFPDIIQPPLYPVFSGFFSLLFSMEMAAKLTSALFGLLLVFGVYRFALFLKEDKIFALMVAWVTALHPALVKISSEAASESMYLFFIFCGFALGWLYLQKQQGFLLVLTSLSWLAAFLTRAEGITFFVIQATIFFIFLVRQKGKRWHFLLFLTPFIIGSLIYVQFTSSELGYKTLSPKLKFVRTHARLAAHFREDIETAPAELRELHIKYRLTPDGTEQAAKAMLYRTWKPPVSAARDSSRPDFLLALNKRLFYNLLHIPMKLKSGFVSPVLFSILLLLGLYKLPFKKEKRLLLIYSAVTGIAGLSFLLSHIEDRFLFSLLPFAVFPAGYGLWSLVRLWHSKVKKTAIARSGTGLIVLVLFLGFLYSYRAINETHAKKDYYHQAGVTLKEYVGKNDTVVAAVPQAVFFSGAKYSILPFASFNKLLLYLHQKKTNYVLLESRDIKNNPVARTLLETLYLTTEFQAAGNTFYLLSLKRSVE